MDGGPLSLDYFGYIHIRKVFMPTVKLTGCCAIEEYTRQNTITCMIILTLFVSFQPTNQQKEHCVQQSETAFHV